jgi:hypothetical protein
LTTENTENTEKNSKDELAKKPRRALLVRAASLRPWRDDLRVVRVVRVSRLRRHLNSEL